MWRGGLCSVVLGYLFVVMILCVMLVRMICVVSLVGDNLLLEMFVIRFGFVVWVFVIGMFVSVVFLSCVSVVFGWMVVLSLLCIVFINIVRLLILVVMCGVKLVWVNVIFSNVCRLCGLFGRISGMVLRFVRWMCGLLGMFGRLGVLIMNRCLLSNGIMF